MDSRQECAALAFLVGDEKTIYDMNVSYQQLDKVFWRLRRRSKFLKALREIILYTLEFEGPDFCERNFGIPKEMLELYLSKNRSKVDEIVDAKKEEEPK
jgi:hypothetical protein